MILHTGGAKGSDYYFAKYALSNNISVRVHSFVSANVLEFNGMEIVRYSNAELDNAYDECNRACRALQRRLPNDRYCRNLILRDYFQIKDSQCVFAVAQIDSEGRTVKGGTGWAVEMAKHKQIPILVYSEIKSKWYKYGYDKYEFEIINTLPPTGFIKTLAFSDITGIGTRNICENGIKELERIFH